MRLKALTPTARQWKNTQTHRRAEFGFLEAVRHCNDAIGKVRNVKHVDAKLSKYVTNRWPEVLRPELERAVSARATVRWIRALCFVLAECGVAVGRSFFTGHAPQRRQERRRGDYGGAGPGRFV